MYRMTGSRAVRCTRRLDRLRPDNDINIWNSRKGSPEEERSYHREIILPEGDQRWRLISSFCLEQLLFVETFVENRHG